MQTINTQYGEIQIHPIERETFAYIRQLLTFGAVGLGSPQNSEKIVR